MNRLIQDVELKPLITHQDERGWFREVLRITDPIIQEGFGQLSWTLMHQGICKAFHWHKLQVDWWLVPAGVIKAVLHDLREESATYQVTNEFLMGQDYDPMILKIPPGVAHGLKVIQGPAHLFYVTSRVYDPKDEGRIPYDDEAIGYDWLKGPDIK